MNNENLVLVLASDYKSAMDWMHRNNEIVNKTVRRIVLPEETKLRVLNNTKDVTMYAVAGWDTMEDVFKNRILKIVAENNINFVEECK